MRHGLQVLVFERAAAPRASAPTPEVMESIDLFSTYYPLQPPVWGAGEVEVAISFVRLWRAVPEGYAA